MSLHAAGEVEVYETEDDILPEEINEDSEKFESKDIEKIHFDVKGSMRRFGNCYLDAEGADFTRTLKGIKRSYKSYEILEADSCAVEDPDQRFERLKVEIEEFIANFGKYKQGSGKEPYITKSMLEKLGETLSATTQIPQQTNEKSTTKELKQPTAELDSELHNRLKRIEDYLYGQKGSTKLPACPLLENIQNLQLQVRALNSQFVEKTSAQITNALAKFSELEEKRTKQFGEGTEKKFDHMSEIAMKLDAACDNIPTTLRRLQSLAKLHEHAQQFSAKLDDLVTLKQHVEKKTENHQMTLFELKKETSKMFNELLGKTKELDARLSKIS